MRTHNWKYDLTLVLQMKLKGKFCSLYLVKLRSHHSSECVCVRGVSHDAQVSTPYTDRGGGCNDDGRLLSVSFLSASGVKHEASVFIKSISTILHNNLSHSYIFSLSTEKMGKTAPSVFSGLRSGTETVLNARSTQPIRK